jgi:hypothetical protein
MIITGVPRRLISRFIVVLLSIRGPERACGQSSLGFEKLLDCSAFLAILVWAIAKLSMPRWVEIVPEAVLELAPASVETQAVEARARGRLSHAIEVRS